MVPTEGGRQGGGPSSNWSGWHKSAPLLHQQPASPSRTTPGCHQKPLEHRKLAALDLGRDLSGRPVPSAQGPWTAEPGHAAADWAQPVEKRKHLESRHPGQAAQRRMGRGLSAQSPPRIRRDALPPTQRSFGHGPVHTQPTPVQPLQFVVTFQTHPPQFQEHSSGNPLLKAQMPVASKAFHWQPVRST